MLPIPKNIELLFMGGQEERTDTRVMKPPALTQAVNVYYDKVGRLEKRHGFTALGRSSYTAGDGNTNTAGTISAGRKLSDLNGNLVMADGSKLYAYSQGTSIWRDIGELPECCAGPRFGFGHAAASDPSSADLCHDSTTGLTLYAWTAPVLGSGSSLLVSVRDGDGLVLANRAIEGSTAGTIGAVRCVMLGGKAVITWTKNADNNIYGVTVTMTGGTFAVSGISTLVTDYATYATGECYDMCLIEGTGGTTPTQFIVAYLSTTALNIKIKKFSNAFVAGTTATHVAAATPTGVAIRSYTSGNPEAEQTVLAYSYTSGGSNLIDAVGYPTDTLVAFTAAFGVTGVAGATNRLERIGLERESATIYRVVGGSQTGGAAPTIVTRSFYPATATTIGTFHQNFNVRLVSKPRRVGSKTFALVHFGTAGTDADYDSGTYYLVDIEETFRTSDQFDPLRAAARVAPRQARRSLSVGSRNFTLPQIEAIGVGGNLFETVIQADASGSRSGLYAQPFDFGAPRQGNIRATGLGRANLGMLRFGDVISIACGSPTLFDGGNTVENGFAYYPEDSSGAPTANVGTIPVGVYGYAFVYEFLDSAGNLHQSAPFKIAVTVAVANRTVDLTCVTLGIVTASKPVNNYVPKVNIAVYRTAVNRSVFYRLGSVANDTSFATVTFTDTGATTDALLETQQQLYTEGQVANLCPPSATIQRVHKGRLWLAGCDDPTQLWFSKAQVPGEFPGFNDDFVLTLPYAITGLEVMDGTLVIFTKNRIFMLAGDPPDDSGQGSSLDFPREVASDVGCIDPRSVVQTPNGVMFQAGNNRIYLLSRGGEVKDMSSLEDTMETYPNVVSATLVPEDRHVRFCVMSSDEASEGTMLVFDYFVGQWFRWDVVPSTVAGAALVNDTYYILSTAGAASYHNTATWLDNGGVSNAWVNATWATAEINMAGIQGFQRVWRIGLLVEPFSACQLGLLVYTDYSAAASQTKTFTSAEVGIEGFGTGKKIEPQLYVKQQRCQSVRLVMQESAPANPADWGTGRGCGFTGVTMEIGLEPGLNRVRSGVRG